MKLTWYYDDPADGFYIHAQFAEQADNELTIDLDWEQMTAEVRINGALICVEDVEGAECVEQLDSLRMWEEWLQGIAAGAER